MTTWHKGGRVRLDGAEVDRQRMELGLTYQALAEKADVSIGTVNNVIKGNRPVLLVTAHLFREALGVEDLASILKPRPGTETQTSADVMTVREYQITDVVTADWLEASNGLRFQICRLRNLELDRLARGKRFDLRQLSTDDEQRCRTWIKRHPIVCESVKDHPNIIRNITAFSDPKDSIYWVIDEWVEGQTLSERLRAGPLTHRDARQLMVGIAEGLAAIHALGIIRRELSPESILIRSDDGAAVLTEFELSKLISHGVSVSPKEWPADDYRAIDAESVDVDQSADVYSWARVSLHMLAGELPPVGQHKSAVRKLKLRSNVSKILEQSLSKSRDLRPAGFRPIIAELKKWKVQ